MDENRHQVSEFLPELLFFHKSDSSDSFRLISRARRRRHGQNLTENETVGNLQRPGEEHEISINTVQDRDYCRVSNFAYDLLDKGTRVQRRRKGRL